MAADIQSLRPYLQDFDLTGLMVEELGWNHYRAAPVAVSAGGEGFELSPVAGKAGFAVYRCGPNVDGAIPRQDIRRQIETQVAQINYEHLIISADAAETRQVLQWVKRESGRPPAVRELRYDRGQSGTALLQRLRGIEFTLEEEGNLGISDVTEKFQQSLDVERVTKRFFLRFSEELAAFQKFIDGFTVQGDRDWYASLTGCLKRWDPGQAAQHQSGHRDVNPCSRGFTQPLIVLAQTPLQVQPAEGAFHYPAPRQYLENMLLRGPAHQLQTPATRFLGPLHQLAAVGSVGPNQL